MAKNRKLGKTTAQRKALLRTQVTDLLVNEKINTTLARAKETQAIANSLIALAIKEKDNFEMEEKKIVRAKRDTNGNKVTELVKSKNGKEYLRVVKEEVTEKRQKDMPSRLHARRQMLKVLYPVVEVKDGKKRSAKEVDLVEKLFTEIAPKYESRNGGYTRIVKIGLRKGDAAMEVLLELV